MAKQTPFKKRSLNPFKAGKKEVIFDPSPKMGADGTVYITKVTMSVRMNRNQYACANEQMIFSEHEVPKEQILELEAVVDFLAKNQDGRVEVSSFECDLRTVRNLVIVEGR